VVMYDRKKFLLLDGTQRNKLMKIILYKSISTYFYCMIKSRKQEFTYDTRVSIYNSIVSIYKSWAGLYHCRIRLCDSRVGPSGSEESLYFQGHTLLL
jgi:hypothetical protein